MQLCFPKEFAEESKSQRQRADSCTLSGFAVFHCADLLVSDCATSPQVCYSQTSPLLFSADMSCSLSSLTELICCYPSVAQRSNLNFLPWWFGLFAFHTGMAAVSDATNNAQRVCPFSACSSASWSLLKDWLGNINMKPTKLYFFWIYFQILQKIFQHWYIYGTWKWWIITRIALAHCSIPANWTTSLFHLSWGLLFHPL